MLATERRIMEVEVNEGLIQKLDENTLIDIFKYLPLSSLYSCFLVQKKWSYLKPTLLPYPFGFDEKQFPNGPAYLMALLREVESLYKKNLIPQHLLAYKNEEKTKLSLERTLFNLRSLTNEELIDLISDENFYEKKKEGAEEKQELIHYFNQSHMEKMVIAGRDHSFLKTPIYMHDLAAVKLLVHCGVSINEDGESDTPPPIHYAIEVGSLKIFDFLLENGADVNAKAKHPAGLTPLHNAALKGYGYCVYHLIKKGANVNAKTPKGTTPLMCAMGSAKRDIIMCLINHGADIDELSYEKAKSLNDSELIHFMKVRRGFAA